MSVIEKKTIVIQVALQMTATCDRFSKTHVALLYVPPAADMMHEERERMELYILLHCKCPQPLMSVGFRFFTLRSSPMDFDTKGSSKQDGAKERVDAEALLAGAVERVFRLRTALKETEAEAHRIRQKLRAELMTTKGDTTDFEIDGKICELVTSDVIGFVNQKMQTKHVAAVSTGATSDDRAVGVSQKNLESQANMQVDMKVEKAARL